MKLNNRRNAHGHDSAQSPVKSKQGFAEAWRSGSHAYRGKTVLAFFLAALLCTMQPSGYSLYRAWGGDAVSPGAFQAEAADSDLAASTPTLQADGDAPNSVSKTYNSVITYYADPADAPALTYFIDDEGGKVNVKLANGNTAELPLAMFYQDSNWLLDANGNTLFTFGADDVSEEKGDFGVAYPGAQATDTITGLSYEPTQKIWRNGYQLRGWYIPNLGKLGSPQPRVPKGTAQPAGGYEEGRDTQSGLPAYDLTQNTPVVLALNNQPSTSAKTVTLADYSAGVDQSNGQWSDVSAYGDWVLRDGTGNGYSVSFKIDYFSSKGVPQETALTLQVNPTVGLNWTSEFDMSNLNLAQTMTKLSSLEGDYILWESVDKNGQPSGNGWLGSKGSFWEAANSTMVANGVNDPYYGGADGTYSGTGALTIKPGIGVLYDASGYKENGSGGILAYASGGTIDRLKLIYSDGTKQYDSTTDKVTAINQRKLTTMLGATSDGEPYTVLSFDDAHINAPEADDQYTYESDAIAEGSKKLDRYRVVACDESSGLSVGDVVKAGDTLASGLLTGSVKLEAMWKRVPKAQDPVKINLDYNTGAKETADSGITSERDVEVNPADPLPTGAKENYLFVGWSKSTVNPGSATRRDYDSSSGVYFTDVPEDVTNGETYHAVYEPLVAITFAKSGNAGSEGTISDADQVLVGAVTGRTADGVDLDSAGVGPTASPASVSDSASVVFDKWTGGKIASGGITEASLSVTKAMLNMNGNGVGSGSGNYQATEFTANFADLYSVSFEAEGGALVAAAEPLAAKVKSGTVVADGNVPTPGTADAGYGDSVTWYKKASDGTETELDNGPAGQTISEDTTFVAKFAAQTPTVTFELPSGSENGLALNGETSQTVAYNQSVNQAVSAGTLTVPSSITVPDTLKQKYTGNIAGFTSGSSAANFDEALTAAKTYTATPELQKYTVRLVVVGGYFDDDKTNTREFANVEYGAKTAGIDGLSEAYAQIKNSEGYQEKANGTWTVSNSANGAAADPTSASTELSPSTAGSTVTYTLTLEPFKPRASFEVAYGYDVSLSSTATKQVDYNTAVASGDVPTLDIAAWQGAHSGKPQKYAASDNVTWTVKGKEELGQVDPATYKLKENTTFVATPKLADITVTFKIGKDGETLTGTWGDGTTDDKTVTVQYGDEAIPDIPANMKAASGYVQAAGSWSTPDPAEAVVEGTPFDGFQPVEYTYTFAKETTDTYMIEGGTWSENGSSTIERKGVSGVDASAVPDTDAVAPANGYTDVGYWKDGNKPAAKGKISGQTYTYVLREGAPAVLRIVGGTWDSSGTDSADRTITVPKGATPKSSDIPTGMTVASGYEGTGSWDKDPATTTVSGNESETPVFTYSYAAKPAEFTVEVYLQELKKSGDAELNEVGSTYAKILTSDKLSQVNSTTVHTGDTVTVADAQAIAEGLVNASASYDLNGMAASASQPAAANLVLGASADDNVIRFYYDRKKFTVAYEMNHAKAPADIPADAVAPSDATEYYYGAPVTVKAIPTTSVPGSDHYWFNATGTGSSKKSNGWVLNGADGTYYNPAIDGASTTFTMPAQNSTLSGTWSRDTVTVVFTRADTNEGNGDIEKLNDDIVAGYQSAGATVTNGKTIQLTDLPVGTTVSFPVTSVTTTGYFRHWTTDKTDVENKDKIVASIADFVATEDVTYYAVFGQKVVVSYSHDAAGIGTFTATSDLIERSANVPLPPADAGTSHQNGYTFLGWTWDGRTTTPSGGDSDPGFMALVGTSESQKTPETSAAKAFEFTAVYEGLGHKAWLDLGGSGATLTGYAGTENDPVLPTAQPDASNFKTGDLVPLPSTAQLTRNGYNLVGFKVTELGSGAAYDYTSDYNNGLSDDKKGFTPGGTFQVKAADNTADVALKVEPIWEPKTNTITYRYVADEGSPTFPAVPDMVPAQAYDTSYKVNFANDAQIVSDDALSGVSGYIWKGWEAKDSKGSTVTIKDGSFTMPDDDVVITGRYEIKKYEVTFKLDATKNYTEGDYNSLAGSGLSRGATWDSTEKTLTATVSWGTDVDALLKSVSPVAYDTAKYAGTVTWTASDPTSAGKGPIHDKQVVSGAKVDDDTTTAGSGSSGVSGKVTFTGELAPALYTVKLVVKNGTYAGAATSETGLAIGTEVPYGTSASSVITSEAVGKIAGNADTAAFGWVGGDPTATDEGVISITGNRVFTYEYKQARTVKFVVQNGTWKNYPSTPAEGDGWTNSATYEFKVADGATIPADEIAKVIADSNVAATATSGYNAEDGAWLSGAPDAETPVTTDQTFTYRFPPNKYKYKVAKYYEKLDGTGYDHEESDVQTVEAGADFGTTLTASDLSSVYYNAGKEGFTNQHQAPASVSPEPRGSVTIATDDASNEFVFYYNRERLNVSYQWEGTAPAGAMLPTGGEGVKYGTKFTVENGYLKAKDGGGTETTTADINGNQFKGWRLSTDTSDTPVNQAGKEIEITDETILIGSWDIAKYDVTYQVDAVVDATPYGASKVTETVGDTTGLIGAEPILAIRLGNGLTTRAASLTDTATYGDKAKAPAVSISTAKNTLNTTTGSDDTWSDVYELDKWTYHTGSDATERDVAGNDPSSMTIDESGYVFTAHFKRKAFTVTYTAGDHGVAFAPATGDSLEGITVFSGVKYGTARPEPHIDSANLATSCLDGEKIKVLTADKAGYTLSDDAWPWVCAALENTASASAKPDPDLVFPAQANTGTSNIVYKAKFDPVTYSVRFLNADESSIKDIVKTGDTLNASTELGWQASIFTPKADAGDATKLFTSDQVASAKAPTMEGKTFVGWHAATPDGSQKSGYAVKDGTLSSSDITVSSLFAASGATAGETRDLYVWAEWSNNPATLTYHSNYGTDATATKAPYKVGDKPSLATAASLASGPDGIAAFSRAGYTFVGWSTNESQTADSFDADTNASDFLAGATEYELTQDTSEKDGVAQTNDLYAVWRPNTYTVKWNELSDDGASVVEREKSFTYSDATTTYQLDAVSTDKVPRPTGDEEAVFADWTIGSTGEKVANGGTLTQAQLVAGDGNGGVIELSPNWTGKVRLTFSDGVPTDSTIEVPADMVKSKPSNAGDAKATFNLNAEIANIEPVRKGYVFAGWKIGAETITPDDVKAGGGKDVELGQDATATAQWTPGLSMYTVEQYFQVKADDGTYDYPDSPQATTELWGTTDGEGTLSGLEADGTTQKAVEATVEGYGDPVNYANVASIKTTITSDGKATIKLYYEAQTYTVTFKFTGIDEGDESAVAAVTPKTVTLHTGDAYVFTDAAGIIPTGYEKADADQGDSWQYEKKNGIDLTTGEVEYASNLTITGDTVVAYPIKKREFTVTYKLKAGDDKRMGKWADAATEGDADAADKVESHVKYGTEPKMQADDGSNPFPPEPLDKYEDPETYKSSVALAGWAVLQPDGSIDESNLVSPGFYQVKEDTTFVAVFKRIHVVSYLPGGHAYSDFAGDPQNNKTTFQNLGASTAGKYSAADVELILSDAEWESAGVPKAKAGYTFLGWAVNKDGVDQGGTGYQSITIDGTRYDYTTNLPLAEQDNDADYVFTAIWDATEQTVTFLPGDHASDGATSVEKKGKTGSKANAPAAPEPAAYYEFAGWELTEAAGATLPATLGGNGAFDVPAVNGVVYTAAYDPVTVELKYASEDESKGTVSKQKDASVAQVPDENGDALFGAVASPMAGFEFVNWTAVDKDGNALDLSEWDPTSEELAVLPIADSDGAEVYQEATFTAHFAAIQPEVTFVLDEASEGRGTLDAAPGKQVVSYGGNVVTGGAAGDATHVIWTPAEGYLFDEWTYDMQESVDGGGTRAVSGTGVADPNSVAIKGDTVFTLKFKPGASTLSFDGNGATGGSTPSVSGLTGNDVKVSTNGFTRAGYKFKGWSTNPNRAAADFDAAQPSDYAPGDDYTLLAGDSNNVLYAVWGVTDVSVEYHSNYKDTGLAEVVKTGTAAYGTALPVAKASDLGIATTGYTRAQSGVAVPAAAVEFKGWSTDPGATAPEYAVGDDIPGSALEIPSDEPLRLFAVWGDKSFTVSFDGNGATSGSMSDIQAVYGQNVEIPQNGFQRANYRFIEWKGFGESDATRSNDLGPMGDSTGAATSFSFLYTEDVELVAQWELEPGVSANITVQFMANDGSKIGELANQYVSDQPMYTYTVSSKAHFAFDGWFARQAGGAEYRIGDANNSVKLEGILKTYYDASVPATYLGTPFWNGDSFGADYPAGAGVVVPLYQKFSMKDYTVKFDPNNPYGYEGRGVSASERAAMADQVIDVANPEKLKANAYTFPGYRFLGWVKADSKPASPVVTAAQYAALSGTVKDQHDTNPQADGHLVDVDGQVAEVTLYALWEAVPNTVEFYDRYEGDGLLGIDHRYDITEGLGWNDPITATIDTGNPTTYAAPHENYAFEGWYAIKFPATKTGPSVVADNYIPVAVGDSGNRFGSVVEALVNAGEYASATPDGDGSYNVKLFARYTRTGMRVVYHEGASNATASAVPAAQTLTVGPNPTAVTLSAVTLPKQGYEQQGWTTSATVWNIDDEDFARGANMSNDGLGYYPVANQTTDVELYPAYKPKAYTVSYEYKTLPAGADYSSLKKATVDGNGIDTFANGHDNVAWSTDELASYGVEGATAPTLDGYTFDGWFVDAGFSRQVFDSWPLELVASTIGAPDSQTEFTLYAKWKPATYEVTYDLGQGSYTKGSLPDRTNLTWADKPTGDDALIPDPQYLQREGFAQGSWYLDEDGTVPAIVNGLREVSYADLYRQWAKVDGNADSPVPDSITLFAYYKQASATITFTVADKQNSYLASGGGASLPQGTTTLSLTVNKSDGIITEAFDQDGDSIASALGKDIGAYRVVAGRADGFDVAMWEAAPGSNGNDYDAQDDGITVSKADGAQTYADGTYTYEIEGNAVGFTVVREEQKADGSGYNVAGSQEYPNEGKVGETVYAADYIDTGVPAGFHKNEASASGSIDLKPNAAANVLTLRYDRNVHDVSFVRYEWPDAAGAVSLPDDRPGQLFGSAQALPTPSAAGYRFDGWYYADANGERTDDKAGSSFSMPDEDVRLVGVWLGSGPDEGPETQLEFDLNEDSLDGNANASWTDAGKQAGYDQGVHLDKGASTTLPGTADATARGYTLKNWLYDTGEVDDQGNPVMVPYAAGTIGFKAPAGAGEVTRLLAEWEEDQVVFSYSSANASKGTVAPSGEQGGAWTIRPDGSTPVPASNYHEFVGWKMATDAGLVDVTDGNGAYIDETGTLTPWGVGSNGSLPYESRDFVAYFKGKDCEVTFRVADGQDMMGYLVDATGSERVDSSFVAEYGEPLGSAIATQVVAVPKRGYKLDAPDYWTYTVRDLLTDEVVGAGATADPASVEIRGETEFVAHFTENDSAYQVVYDTTGLDFDSSGGPVSPATASDSQFGPRTVGWSTANLGADASGNALTPVKPGFTFLGWFVVDDDDPIEPEDAYSDFAVDEDQESVVLHAHWEMKEGYTLYFNPNGGSWDGDSAVLQLEDLAWRTQVNGYDTEYQVENPERFGYQFAGWYDESGAEAGTLVVGKKGEAPRDVPYSALAKGNDSQLARVTVYAHWDMRTFTVDYLDGSSVIDSANVKYTGSVAHDGLGDDENRDFLGWFYLNGDDEEVDLVAGTSVESMIADGAELTGEGHLQVYARWVNVYSVTTNYVPYVLNNTTREYDQVTGTNWSVKFKENLVKVQTRVREGSDASAWQVSHPDYKVPGFEYSASEARLADGSFNEADLVIADIAADASFDIPIVAKHDYKVKYNLNDQEAFELSGAVLKSPDSYVEKTVKTFADDDNIPTESDGEASVPTRPGFNFVEWVNHPNAAEDAPGRITAFPETLYGDLAVTTLGDWYDPETYDPEGGTPDNSITLFATWAEKSHKVVYMLADDSADRGEIKLNDSHDEFGTDEIFETIGAATGYNADGEQPFGAVAQAKRGYTFVRWVVSSDKGETIRNIWKDSDLNASAVDVVMGALAVQVAGDERLAAALDEAGDGLGAVLAAQADGGWQPYDDDAEMKPGINEAGLFAGLDDDAGDDDSSVVRYAAEFKLNEMVEVTYDPNGADSYSGRRSQEQPVGTYVGEEEPWGTKDGELPAASLISRDGYTFGGWEDVETGTIYQPGSESASTIPVTGAMQFRAVWNAVDAPEATSHSVSVDDVTLPDGTVVKGTTWQKANGSKMSSAEIESILNRGGMTPSAWTVTLYADDGTVKSTQRMTGDQLRTYLQQNAINDTVVISVPADATWGAYEAPAGSSQQNGGTRPASTPKTGDSPVAPIALSVTIGLSALLAVIAVRKRREADEA